MDLRRLTKVLRLDKRVLAASLRGIKVNGLALVIATIANLLTQYTFAEDISTQPLTRADCARVGMEWDENANVCTASLMEDFSSTSDEKRMRRSIFDVE